MLPYLLPGVPKAITIIGAGGIVRDAHLPAYRLAGFPVHGICDLDKERAQAVAKEFEIGRVYADAAEAFRCSPAETVFDLATPPDAILEVLEHAPIGSGVLIQKPLGREINEARAIRALCRRRNLKAAINFQLRYAPAILAARKMIESGDL
jgi:predicted dehydrogenase